MANVLPTQKRVEVVAHLVEGASVRSTSRLTGACKQAILSLLVRLGEGCDRLHDRLVRDLDIRDVQVDEIWSYVQKKQSRVTEEDPAEWGDAYTFVALARVSKVVIAYRAGKRDRDNTEAFIEDLRARLLVVPQLSSDGFQPYVPAVAANFLGAVDFAVVHKNYRRGSRPDGLPEDRRYEPPRDPFVTKIVVRGAPDPKLISTSHVERQNMTMRMHIRRMTRLCNGFSRKLANHRAAVALHFAWYNFCRVHESLRVTPAMEARIAGHVWSLEELVTAALAEPAGEAPTAKPLRLPEPLAGVVAAPARELPGGRGFLRLVKGSPAAPAAPPPGAGPPVSPTPAGPAQLGLFDPSPTGPVSTAKPRPMRQMDLFDEDV